MKLLVTGGAGFIGSNFIRYWLKKYPGDTIVNLDAMTYAGNPENLADMEDNPSYKFVKGNILDAALVGKIIKDVDTVVNFAAETHVDRSIADPDVFLKTNILGTQVMLKAALENKIKKFHHISTDEVFGSLALDAKNKFSESSPYSPNSPYAASKAASDHLVNAFFVTYGLPVTITNCSNNYGPFQHPEKFIPLIITNAMEGVKVPIYGDGKNVRDWLFVEDHARAIDLVLNFGAIGETYCVGGMSEDISNIEIAQSVLKILKKDSELISFVSDRPGHDRKYSVDWTKIGKELGYKPQHSLDEWLEKTVNWYKENQKWWKRLKTSKFRKYYKEQYPDL